MKNLFFGLLLISSGLFSQGKRLLITDSIRVGNTQIGDFNGYATKVLSLKSITGNYTLVGSDSGKIIGSKAATSVVITVPPHSSVAFPVGMQIGISQDSTGQISFAKGAGVSINTSNGDSLKLLSKASKAYLIQRAIDQWDLVGDLVQPAIFGNPANAYFGGTAQAIVNGNVVVGLVNQYTGENESYYKVTTYADGTTMTDAKVDNILYQKINGTYYRRAGNRFSAASFGILPTNSASVNADAIQKVVDIISPLSFTDANNIMPYNVVTVVFPSEIYQFSHTIHINNNNNFPIFTSEGNTTLLYTGSDTAFYIGNRSSNGQMPFRMSNITLKKADRSAGSIGILIAHASYPVFTGCSIQGFEKQLYALGTLGLIWDGQNRPMRGGKYAFLFESDAPETGGLRVACNNNKIRNVHIGGGTSFGYTLRQGITAQGLSAGNNNQVDNVTFEGIDSSAVVVEHNGESYSLDKLQISNCHFEHYGVDGINLHYARLSLSHNFFAGATRSIIRLHDSQSSLDIDNNFGYFFDSYPADSSFITFADTATVAGLKDNIIITGGTFAGIKYLYPTQLLADNQFTNATQMGGTERHYNRVQVNDLYVSATTGGVLINGGTPNTMGQGGRTYYSNTKDSIQLAGASTGLKLTFASRFETGRWTVETGQTEAFSVNPNQNSSFGDSTFNKLNDNGNRLRVQGTVTAATPTDPTHLTTKAYVDARKAATNADATSANATDLPSAITLINELKQVVNLLQAKLRAATLLTP